MAETDISVANQALVRIGGAAITSFTDGTTESSVASTLYETYVRGQLALTRWNWAKKDFSLNKNSDTPLEMWDYGYDVPSDLLVLHRVLYGDRDIEFERFKDLIYTNQDNDADDVVAIYTYRVDENDWPADFLLSVVTGLAAQFATSLARDDKMAAVLSEEGAVLFAQSRRNDAQGQTAKRANISRLTGARLRGARG
tara:strand:- start:2843 stop:3433 length:591 start_codon:yes stop_codon:yes gene_type:complete